MAAVKELTRGWGADVVCDFVGFPSVIPEGLQMLKSGGTYLEIGHISPGHKSSSTRPRSSGGPTPSSA